MKIVLLYVAFLVALGIISQPIREAKLRELTEVTR